MWVTDPPTPGAQPLTFGPVSLVPADVNLILEQDKPVALYPDLFSEALIHCTDGNLQPDAVYWFRTLLPAAAAARAQFLGKLNNADVFSPGEGVSRDRFKSRKKTKNVFSLKIINVTEEDAGLYSCVMKDRKATEVWKPGVLLLPGGSWGGRSLRLHPARWAAALTFLKHARNARCSFDHDAALKG